MLLTPPPAVVCVLLLVVVTIVWLLRACTFTLPARLAMVLLTVLPVKVKPWLPVDAALPEPTTPEEIDQARKQAMIDGREKDVIKYCEMMKVDDKTDPQIRLGCTLAACRVNDADKARGWSAALPKELKGIAVKTCLELKVGL